MPSRAAHLFVRVRRRCLVCDHEVIQEETADTFAIGVPCSACRAPTERIETLTRRWAPVERNPHAAALGRLGGLKGGPARAAALTPERRRAIASLAARKRWSRERDSS